MVDGSRGEQRRRHVGFWVVDRDCKVLLGSNREAEFSAYEEGRRSLVAEPGSTPDVWMILNDRLSFYKADCVWAATPALLQFASSVPIAVGTVDFLPRYFKLRGQKFRCYVRSNYVLVSSGALDRIGSLCTVTADEYALAVPLRSVPRTGHFPDGWDVILASTFGTF